MVVVVGVDDSPQSVDVLQAGIEEARWRGAEVHAVHVFEPPLAYLEVPIDIAEMAGAEREAVWNPLEAILAASPVRATRVDLDGYPGDMLVGHATEVGAELVVVGSRGRGELASIILGSTSHRVIHTAECDVLVVKAKRPAPQR